MDSGRSPALPLRLGLLLYGWPQHQRAKKFAVDNKQSSESRLTFALPQGEAVTPEAYPSGKVVSGGHGVGAPFGTPLLVMFAQTRRLIDNLRDVSNAVEYLFAAALSVADQAARKQGWRPSGRTAWQKPNGTIVYFVCLAEQLAVIPAGATVYVVGAAPRLKRSCRLVALAA